MSASTTLFEIQRIWDVWPTVHNQQVFRELFRQLSTTTTAVEGAISVDGVFVFPGHVFIAISSKLEKGQAKLYAFSCILPTRNLNAHDDHVTSSLLDIGKGSSKVINVIKGTTDQQLYVVLDNAKLISFNFCYEAQRWRQLECHQLSDLNIHSCIFHHGSSNFVTCEKLTQVHSSHSYQIVARRQTDMDNGSFVLAKPRVILAQTPPLQLIGYEDGVCFVPCDTPYPNGLLLFWAFDEASQSDVLKPFVWNCSSMMHDLNSGGEPLSFKTVVLRLSGACSKAVKDPFLVSMTVNPLTNQLLALANDGTVYTLRATSQGQPERFKLTELVDFAHRLSTVTSLFAPPCSVHIFTMHTFICLFIKGEIRVYDAFSGEFVWETDEHEGSGAKLWTMPSTPNFCGVYDNSGVWLLRSKKAADQAYFIANALFPISTNADETTPGNYLENGQVLSAKMCKLWGLRLWGVKYMLEAGFEKIKGNNEEKQSIPKCDVPYLSRDLVSLFKEESSLQNPALLVALVTECPAYREELREPVERFLLNYQLNGQDLQEHANDLLTPLNTEIVPLLEKYCELEKERKELFTEKSVTDSNFTGDVRHAVCRLLSKTEGVTSASEEMIASTRSRLHSLCYSHPEEALLGIKDFFEVNDFKEAVEQLQSGYWNSRKNWKGIFATEKVKCHQTSGYMQPSQNHIPLFEETCRLIYRTHPEMLLTFVTFAQLARDYQALEDSAFARKCRKEFFYHRALLTLPVFVSPDLTPVSPEAVRVHSQLLLCSGYPNAEMTSVQLLLSNNMWEDAISLMEQTKHETNHCALFHCLIFHLVKGGVLYKYIDDVWKLLPKNFSVFDFLSLLKGLKKDESQEPPILDTNTLTVSAIAPRILNLLKQSKLT